MKSKSDNILREFWGAKGNQLAIVFQRTFILGTMDNLGIITGEGDAGSI